MSIACRACFNIFKRKDAFCGIANYSKLTLADNGNTIVAFHPDKKFPYELTRPLPEETVIEDKSVLKMNNISEVVSVFKDVNPVAAREHLMKLTLTTKHCWFPKPKEYWRRKRTAMEKPYL